jgi:capsular polysaccharide biosynthesis protein
VTPIQYLRAFARFWWLIAICIVLGAALALALSGVLRPPYTSTSRVLVSTTSSASTNPSDAYQGTLLAQQRVLSYAEIARGPALTNMLIDDLGLRSTSDELAAHIRVSVPANTAVLDISVDNASSSQAKRIATDAADVVADLINTQESARGQGTPLLRARAVGGATTPTASTTRRNLALGGAGGLVLGLILAVAASRLDRRLRDEDAVAQAAGREVTGVLPLHRRRVRLGRTRTLPSRADAIRELRAARRATRAGSRARRGAG